MAFVGDVFGLNSVYAKQVENVENSNFASWIEEPRYGYYIGGGPTAQSTVDRLDFSTQTVSNSSDLPTVLYSCRGISSNTDGYVLGGVPATNVIRRLDFSSETHSLPGNNLPEINFTSATITTVNADRGYHVGGWQPVAPGTVSSIRSFDVSTESISNLSATLPQGMQRMTSDVVSENYGYFAQGQIPPISSDINRLDLSNETILTMSNRLIPAYGMMRTGTSSKFYGYIAGGLWYPPSDLTVGYTQSKTERLDFATETDTALPNSASQPGAKRSQGSCANSLYGFFGGGGPSLVNLVNRLDFSNDTMTSDVTNLTTGREDMATVQGGQSYSTFARKTIGYFMGGYDGGNSSYVKRMDFTSDTSSTPSMRISHATTGMRGVANNNFGYAMGGFHGNGTPPPSTGDNRESRLHRIDFATENLTVFSATPEAHTDYTTLWGVDDMYGWKAGDLFNAPPSPVGTRSDVRRFDYSTESWNVPGQIQPTRQARGLIFSDIKNRNGITISGSGYIPTVNYNPTTFIKYQTTNDTLTGTPFPALGGNKNSGSSIYNPQYGYYAGGGSSPGPVTADSDVYRLDFSSDTYSDTTANTHANRNGTGASSNHYGYFCQGAPASPPPFALATITKFDFSTETASPVPDMNGGGDHNLGSMSNGI